MQLYFSDRFGVSPQVLEQYGALDISVVTDLPVFIDPFLLFNSSNPEYNRLHEGIIEYLKFLRDEARPDLDPGLVQSWYRFKEVKQNWLGYTQFGNGGHALGSKFATALHKSLQTILSNFGEEDVTRASHLEKLTLVSPGVGKDSISDFTTNLIKDYLLKYTQTFAAEYIDKAKCATFRVPHAAFNYRTKTWETRPYYLPRLGNDFVVLTPLDLLTRDDTWINHADMVRKFELLPDSISNDQLRAQVNQYFASLLGERPTAKDKSRAASATIHKFHELIDLYIRLKEDTGDQAEAVSREKIAALYDALIIQVRDAIPDLDSKSDFYRTPWTSYEEVLQRVNLFKDYVENQDGYLVINRENGKNLSSEREVQLFFGLIWCKSEFDVNRETNNGRGPVDFKVSFGSGDKSLIEFKLARSTHLKRNLENQVAVYEKANRTHKSVKVIICYTESDELKVARVLNELGRTGDQSVVVVDARTDNKPSGSKA
ncbi:hypothetical protein ACNQVK_12245 [Mycobacterium sp. 134]|uniref:hypothetical protein n=1 Tax=Mycobacterium sp. 134 TaxID=3400425 RepID=UPI003AACEE45